MNDFFGEKSENLNSSEQSGREAQSSRDYEDRQQGGRYYNNSEHSYQNPQSEGEREFRPRREFTPGRRPRIGQGGYQRQGSYSPRQEGYDRTEGYQGGGYNRQGGYQRQGGYDRSEGYQGGGYKGQGMGPREGGYQPRPYRPRFNGNGEGYGQPHPYGQRPRFQRQGGYGPQRPQRQGYNRPNQPKRRFEIKDESFDPNEPLRLNKFLANAGVCSRRDADRYIQAGVVKVNGEVVTELGTKVRRSDSVYFHDEPIRMESKVYVLLNKPKGFVTTSEDPQNRKTVMDLVRNACPERIYPVGRLDRNTTGVLLLTNDGELASKLTHPKYEKKKIYHVFLDQNVTLADMQKMLEGVELEDGIIKVDEVQYAHATDKKQVGVQIHSGRNRIVRRLFEALGYHVVKLDRVFFAGLTKKNLRRGDWRFLTEQEVNFLRMGSFN